jgi:methylmalonyl-CoA mutase, C-terminal domain
VSPVRVLLAKPGLDGHDRGIKVIAMALRDAGAEVIYLGLRRPSAEIWKAAVEDDVDVVGISVLSGAHMALARDLLEARDALAPDVPVVIGGTIPAADVPQLLELGVTAVFPVGADLDQVVEGVLAAGRRKVGQR